MVEGALQGTRDATNAIPVSGRFFLQQEPYAGGVAPVADLAPGAGGQRLLLLGFPGDGIWAELVIGAPGAPDQIAREILIDPDHLIRRGFSYPEATVRS